MHKIFEMTALKIIGYLTLTVLAHKTKAFSTHFCAHIDPEVVDIVTFEVRGTTVSMNWENTFQLNGQLRYYILTRNNFTIRQDTQTSIELPNQPRGESKDNNSSLCNAFFNVSYRARVCCDSCY